MEEPRDPDIHLMLRLAGGDDLALNEIMARWRDKVGAFLLRMTGDPTVAVDLAQETFVRLYQSRERYRPTAAFSSYLFQIAANLARTHRRWRVRHPTLPLESGDGLLIDPPDWRNLPDAVAASHERVLAVQEALAALPHDLRAALILFVFGDMSHAEVGATLGCTAKAAEVRIYRGRQLLKAYLADLDA